MFMASSTSATGDIKHSGDDTVGHMFGGLTFLKTKKNRRDVVEFYQTLLGMKIWLEQPNISILSHSNFLLGFQHIKKQDNNSATSITPDTQGCYSFLYTTKEAVDAKYQSRGYIRWTATDQRTLSHLSILCQRSRGSDTRMSSLFAHLDTGFLESQYEDKVEKSRQLPAQRHVKGVIGGKKAPVG